MVDFSTVVVSRCKYEENQTKTGGRCVLRLMCAAEKRAVKNKTLDTSLLDVWTLLGNVETSTDHGKY